MARSSNSSIILLFVLVLVILAGSVGAYFMLRESKDDAAAGGTAAAAASTASSPASTTTTGTTTPATTGTTTSSTAETSTGTTAESTTIPTTTTAVTGPVEEVIPEGYIMPPNGDETRPFKIYFNHKDDGAECSLGVGIMNTIIHEAKEFGNASAFTNDKTEGLSLAFSGFLGFQSDGNCLRGANYLRGGISTSNAKSFIVPFQENTFHIKVKVNGDSKDYYCYVAKDDSGNYESIKLTTSRTEAQLFKAKFVPYKKVVKADGIQFQLVKDNKIVDASKLITDKSDKDVGDIWVYKDYSIWPASRPDLALTAVEVNGGLVPSFYAKEFAGLEPIQKQRFNIAVQDGKAFISHQEGIITKCLTYEGDQWKMVQPPSVDGAPYFKIINPRALSVAQIKHIKDFEWKVKKSSS